MMSEQQLHPDWPAFRDAKHSWDMPAPYDDVASACEAYGSSLEFADIASVSDYLVQGNEGRWTPETPGSVGSELTIVLLGTLRDGRWFGLEGWNDYTGWGCQDGVDVYIGATRDDVIRNGLTTEGRNHLGLALTDGGPVVSGVDLGALRDLAERATNGPWVAYFDDEDPVINAPGVEDPYYGGAQFVAQTSYDGLSGTVTNSDNDAAYIAAASPNVVLALVTEVERLRDAVAGAWQAVTDARNESLTGKRLPDMVHCQWVVDALERAQDAQNRPLTASQPAQGAEGRREGEGA